MKKTLALIPTLFIAVVYFFFFYNGDAVEFEVIAMEDLPEQIKAEVENYKTNTEKFKVFHDETNTYIYYQADHSPNEYITTIIDVKKQGSQYVVTATVSYAVNDSDVSYDALIKLHKISGNEITFKEIDKRHK
jgi:hypothetical protein